MPAPLTEFEERFWDKVAWTLEAWGMRESPCWLWLGATNGRYGRAGLGPRCAGNGYAHRIAYELEIGPIPPGLVLDHLCRNLLCVNPWHLEPVSQAENLNRARLVRV